jgi:hypothetical protein
LAWAHLILPNGAEDPGGGAELITFLEFMLLGRA